MLFARVSHLTTILQQPFVGFRFRYSFICQCTSTMRQQSDLFGLKSQAAICYYQSYHSKVEAIPLSALPKDTTSELAGSGAGTIFEQGAKPGTPN